MAATAKPYRATRAAPAEAGSGRQAAVSGVACLVWWQCRLAGPHSQTPSLYAHPCGQQPAFSLLPHPHRPTQTPLTYWITRSKGPQGRLALQLLSTHVANPSQGYTHSQRHKQRLRT
jgi:hypothetical protein